MSKDNISLFTILCSTVKTAESDNSDKAAPAEDYSQMSESTKINDS